MATQADPREIDLQEQLVRIRKSQADIDKAQAEVRKLIVDTKVVPWQVAIAGMTAGGALVAATAAIVKIFF